MSKLFASLCLALFCAAYVSGYMSDGKLKAKFAHCNINEVENNLSVHVSKQILKVFLFLLLNSVQCFAGVQFVKLYAVSS